MHRVGLPKVALITYPRPKKVSFNFKLVRIVSDFYRGRAALVAYKDFSEIKKFTEELGVDDYFLLDEQRFINYHNLRDNKVMKDIRSLLTNKRIKSSDKSVAEKSDFYIEDVVHNTYWTLI